MDEHDTPRIKLKHSAPTHYDVGYTKPPEATRFKPGKSGNPSGRPKGKKSNFPILGEERLKSIIFAAANRQIKMRENDKTVTLTMADAIVRSLAVNAAKGNNRSAALFMQLLKVTEDEHKAQIEHWVKSAAEYKWTWEKELTRRREHGLPPPQDLYPHPDHIIIDYTQGTIRIDGPKSKEEVEVATKLKEMFDARMRGLLNLQELLGMKRNPKLRKILQEEIEKEQNYQEAVIREMPDWIQRYWAEDQA